MKWWITLCIVGGVVVACESGKYDIGNRSVQTEHTANVQTEHTANVQTEHTANVQTEHTANVQQTQSHSKKNDEKFLLSDFHPYHFDTLIDELHENALRAEKNHNGEYVLIEGYFLQADSGGEYFGINGGPYGTHWFDSICCSMSKKYLVNRVMDFNYGDRLAVFGKVVAVVATGYCVETIAVTPMDYGMTPDDIMAMAEAQANLEQ